MDDINMRDVHNRRRVSNALVVANNRPRVFLSRSPKAFSII
jgi:hypothetical protein